jgi:hypothetical protein
VNEDSKPIQNLCGNIWTSLEQLWLPRIFVRAWNTFLSILGRFLLGPRVEIGKWQGSYFLMYIRRCHIYWLPFSIWINCKYEFVKRSANPLIWSFNTWQYKHFNITPSLVSCLHPYKFACRDQISPRTLAFKVLSFRIITARYSTPQCVTDLLWEFKMLILKITASLPAAPGHDSKFCLVAISYFDMK